MGGETIVGRAIVKDDMLIQDIEGVKGLVTLTALIRKEGGGSVHGVPSRLSIWDAMIIVVEFPLRPLRVPLGPVDGSMFRLYGGYKGSPFEVMVGG